MGLTLEDVRNVADQRHGQQSQGQHRRPGPVLHGLANDQLTHAAPYNNVIIAYRNGAPIRIGDIGRAVRGPQNRELAAWQNGKRGVLLLVFKQPDANVINTVERIKAALPALRGDRSRRTSMSARRRPHADHPRLGQRRGIHAGAVDRAGGDGDLPVPAQRVGDDHPQRHRPGGAGRHAWARCTCCGFSLDNLSLMGLTIAVGFVVDDAIVMLENIYRHIEDGMTPMDAAHQGRRRDRLHHRLDQPVADRRVHPAAADGRHRRPAVPRIRDLRVDHHRGLGDRLADADADDVLALPRPAITHSTAASTDIVEAHVRRHARRSIARTLDIALRFRFITLMVFVATVALTAVLFVTIPKGFFPTQDTGIIIGITEGGAGHLVRADGRRCSEQLNDIVAHDPAVASFASQVGAGTAGQTGQ